MRFVVLLVLLGITIAGASALAFLCDDAFITFRYVANARDGLGLVWNPPPFLPVEGYTGFLWALLLWAVWSWFGVEPPDAANVLSILCGVGQFAVIAWAAFRLRRRDGSRIGAGLALVTVACVVGQRTFLQWMTSGLETALFNLAFVGWALLAFRDRDRRDTRWLVAWSAAAAVAALTRPDGLLLVAVTAAVALPALAAGERRLLRGVVGLLPLAAVVAHVAWRRSFYGEWLPNTYYAKVVKPWPEAGVLYWKCFLFEHGLWLWFPVAASWAIAWVVRHRRGLVAAAWRCLPAIAVLGAIAFHTGYYLLVVGGDHFEYRVLSQLVPLAWLSLTAMGSQLAAWRWAVHALLGLVFVCSGAGWVHYAISRDIPVHGANPLSHKLPAFLRPIWRRHDSMQMYLHIHLVGMRCNQIGANCRAGLASHPPRGNFNPDPDDLPVFVHAVIGVPAWILRDCAIIDYLGLNDWVVARTQPFGDDKQWPEFERYTGLLTAVDRDADGWLDRDELRAWFGTFFGSQIEAAAADPLVDMALDLYGGQRSDSMTKDEVTAFLRGMFARGGMAHERAPPVGYFEAFEPNVRVADGAVTVTKRAVPILPRIAAIEAAFRDRIKNGGLQRRPN